MKTDSERLQKLDLADKDFKASITNMFKQYILELSKNMLTMIQSIVNINKEIKSIRKCQMKILEFQ